MWNGELIGITVLLELIISMFLYFPNAYPRKSSGTPLFVLGTFKLNMHETLVLTSVQSNLT